MAKTTKIGMVTLAGRSGAAYELRVYVWETKFKTLPGVYVVASRTMDPGTSATYEALFVGTAEDLSTVFEDHPHRECFQLYYANTIGVIKEQDAVVRESIVADLIAGLQPPCNADDH